MKRNPHPVLFPRGLVWFWALLIVAGCNDLRLTAAPPNTELGADPFEPDDDFQQSQNIISLDQVQSHTIAPVNDVDVILLDIDDSNLEYQVEVVKCDGPVLLSLKDMSQAVLISGSIYPSVQSEPLRYVFERPGRFYLEISTLRDLFVNYEVRLHRAALRILPDEYEIDNGPLVTNTIFSLGGTQTHTFHNNTDIDFIILDITEVAPWYFFSVTGVWDGLFNPAPVMVIYKPDGGSPYFPSNGSRNAMTIQFDQPGRYFLKINDRKGQLGQYLVAITTADKYQVEGQNP